MVSIDREHGSSKWAPPPFRLDLLHPVDLVEDYCIARGYSSFTPEMPEKFTVGLPAPIMTISDRARELMIGQGFQEMMTYILTNRETLCEKMNDDARPLEMDNVMSESYSAVRSSLVPILLEIESRNSDTEYPHRFFETGEVAVRAPGHPEGTATSWRRRSTPRTFPAGQGLSWWRDGTAASSARSTRRSSRTGASRCRARPLSSTWKRCSESFFPHEKKNEEIKLDFFGCGGTS